MTANQINYQRAKEDRRHNLEVERQGISQLYESQRHNVATEDVNRAKVGADYEVGMGTVHAQSERNAIQSLYNTAQVEETQRHNLETEHRAKVGQFVDVSSAFIKSVGNVLPGFISLMK